MRELCDNLEIKKSFSTVCHPQSNGQTEAVNKIIKHTLKTKLEESTRNWLDELSVVLWSNTTTLMSTTEESHFTLTYGCEAMVVMEIWASSFRRDNHNSEDNEVNKRLYLDLVEEMRALAQIRLTSY